MQRLLIVGKLLLYAVYMCQMFLRIADKISNIAYERSTKNQSFPTLDNIFGEREEPNHNHRDYQHRQVGDGNALQLHRANNTSNT